MQVFSEFQNDLFVRALERYRSTKEYKLLREKEQTMLRDCQTMFTEDEQEFAAECFDLLAENSICREKYLYVQGYRDCLAMLRTFYMPE